MTDYSTPFALLADIEHVEQELSARRSNIKALLEYKEHRLDARDQQEQVIDFPSCNPVSFADVKLARGKVRDLVPFYAQQARAGTYGRSRPASSAVRAANIRVNVTDFLC
jgi:hypothetical protein